MNEQIKTAIRELSEIIFEQTNKLISYEHGAPRIEVDIAKENIRKLYDDLELLINKNWKATGLPKEVEQIKEIEETIDDQVEELLNIATAQFEDDIEQINQQIIEQEEVIEEQAEVMEEEIVVLDEDTVGEPKNEKPEDFIENAVDTKNEKQEPEEEIKPMPKQSPKKEDSSIISDNLNKKPISSLKSAIGINDKFQFINELFDGSMQTFNKAIANLDQARNMDDALNVYNSISENRKWDIESQAYLQLLDYVNRRFI